MVEFAKAVHVCCAVLSLSGFALRGYWMLCNDPRLQRPVTRILPHLVDTLLLGSALLLLHQLQLAPWGSAWLTAKVFALLLYIGLGMVALRFGRTRQCRLAAFILALTTGLYILSVAYTKLPLPLLVINSQ